MVGTSPSRIILGFMLAAASLFVWISKTTTTIMMFAVGLSVMEFATQKSQDGNAARNFGVGLMLCIAYAASIGAVGTLIGMPPNALFASFLHSNYNIQIDFFTWMRSGVTVVLVMLPVAWVLLTKFVFSTKGFALGDTVDVIRAELAALGGLSRGERAVAAVFTATALG